MPRPTLHPVDDKIYTGLLLLISSEDGLTQTEIHNELYRITKDNHTIISTLQKIKKLEKYDLILKEEKGGLRNAKKVYINVDEIIRIISDYLFNIQNEINKEIKQEFSYWKLKENEYEKSSSSFTDFHKILFDNIIKEISTSHEYINNNSYTQNDIFVILSNGWFISLIRYILSFHSRNSQYYKMTFSQLLSSIIEYFTLYYEDIDEYITKSTTEKVIAIQDEVFDLKSEKEIHDYIEGKNRTLDLFEYMRKMKFIQPLYSHSTTALWVLEYQTMV